MPYGFSGNGGYSGNSVGGSSDQAPSFSGGYDTTPSVGNYGGGGGAYSGGQGDAGGGGNGSGMNANMWLALFQGIGDNLNSRFQAGNVAQAAQAAIPSEAYSKALGSMVDTQGVEGLQLAQAQLSPKAKAAATALGSRAAAAHGLQGPLAANLAQSSVNDAQSNWDQWHMQALQGQRANYLQLIQAYTNALNQRRAAIINSNAANREAFWAKVPVGPIGEAIGKGANWDSGAYNTQALPNNNPNFATF